MIYRLQFKNEIPENGQLTVAKDTRIKKHKTTNKGRHLTKFFIGTEKTEYDYSIFMHRKQLIAYITKCTNINELKHIYGEIQGFRANAAGVIPSAAEDNRKDPENAWSPYFFNTAGY